MNPKVLLVDGHSIANRAFYGVPLLTNSKGVYTNALHGFFNILWKVIEQEKPEYLGIAFDLKTPTFRHELYADYKGTRAGMPPELREQIPLLMDMLQKAGIALLTKEGYEADDVLGTIGKEASAAGQEVMILSGDRDLLQLVDEHITLLIPKTKKGGTETEVYHEAEVEEKYGVSPAGYLQMKALMGDPSDNIPGVPSIGEKTAAKIIQAYGTVENAIAHADEIKPPRAAQNLQEFKEQARMSLVLATICTDCNQPGKAGKLTQQSFATPSFIDALKEYELKSLLQRVLQRVPEEADAAKEESRPAADFTAVKNAAELQQIMEKESGALTLMLWPEGFAAAARGRELCFAELGADQVLEALRPLLTSPQIPKITFDVKELYKELLPRRIEMQGPVLDVLLAAYLLNPSKEEYAPDELSKLYLDELAPSETEILGSGVKRLTWQQVPGDKRAAYMTGVTRILSRIAEPMQQELKEKSMESLYETIERPLAEVLASMELWGIAVDLEVLESIGKFLTKEIQTLQEEIWQLAGEPFNINSPKQLGTVLFERLGLPAGKKTKSGYSTSAEVLEKLKWEHPIIAKVLMYRQLTKLESTYV